MSSEPRPDSAGHRQLPLELRYPPDQRFDTFVAAETAAAASQVRALANGSGQGSLYLVGAEGTGKTHLALAACAEAEIHDRSAAYLVPAAARGRLRQALDALHVNTLVTVDGLDAVAGERDDERALFDFHNRVHDAGGNLLYTATRLPEALDWTLPDLRSRLSQCARIALSPLDDAGRREVLRRRAERRGLQMDAVAIDWLLHHVDRDLSSLTMLLDTLDRASLAAQRRITLPFVREVVASRVRGA